MSLDPQLSIILLHDEMVDKQGNLVTTSLTMIDLHDIARSAATYGVKNVFVAHPSGALRKLAHTLTDHWRVGFGASYNPNRKEALDAAFIVRDLDEAIHIIDDQTGHLPELVATSAHQGNDRTSFTSFRDMLAAGKPYLLMLGTGWGMSQGLLERADHFLEPIVGPTPYNHLSVRSACAIMLDKVLGRSA